MKKKILLGCALMFVCACASTRPSMTNIQEPRAIVVPEYTPSIVEVRNAIFSGVHAAKWRAQDRAPGLIYATQRWRGSTVTLEIDYTATSYTILYKDCTDDDYAAESGNIPAEFPRWVAFLAKNIDEKVAVLGIEAQVQIKAFPRIAPTLPGDPVVLEGEFEAEKKPEEGGIVTRFDNTNKASVLVQDAQDVQDVTEKSEEQGLAPMSPAVASPAVTAEPTNNTDEAELVQEKELAPSPEPTAVELKEIQPVEPAPEPAPIPAPVPVTEPVIEPAPVTEPVTESAPVIEPVPLSVTPASTQDSEQEQSTQKPSRTSLGKSVLTPLPTAREQELHMEEAPEKQERSEVTAPAASETQVLEPHVTRAIPVHLLAPSAVMLKQDSFTKQHEEKQEAQPQSIE